MTRLARMAVDKIKTFAVETGEEMIYHQSGSLRIARTAEHEQQLQRDVALGQKLGVDIDFVSLAKARQLMPFFEPAGVQAVTFVRGDLYLEPGQLPRGYARATERLGGVLLPNTSVIALASENRRIAKGVTDLGEVGAPIVVGAAGASTRLVGGSCVGRLHATATQHHPLHTPPSS